MADYFAALAARTLRPELGVQPRQRVRWAEAAAPAADVLGAPEKAQAGGRPSVPDEGELPRRSRLKSTSEPNLPEIDAVAPKPGGERGRRTRARDQEDTSAATTLTPHPTVRAVVPAVRVRFEGVTARSDDTKGKVPAAASARRETTVLASAVERARPTVTRLSVREKESTAEPAIRIHIGRVDVRAVTTAAPVSSPASRDGKRALMSLDEYVQKRDRGVS